jgi:hypothetical protein
LFGGGGWGEELGVLSGGLGMRKVG